MEREETRIVERARAGDGDAFRELVERHGPRLFRLTYRATGEEQAAEDAVQETFLRAYRSLGRFDGRSGFGTWLHRIAVNVCFEHLRKRENREAGGEGPADLPSPAPGPDRVALSSEVERTVQSAMAELSPLERTAFVLRHFEGRSISEICDQLGLRPSAGKAAIFRAVRKLRRVLEPLVQGTTVKPYEASQ